MLHESFEKALKFSFGEEHIWRQYALSLTSLGRHSHSLRALSESTKIAPNDTVQCLLSARICYEHLDKVKEGLDWSQRALQCQTNGSRRSRAQLYVGIGYQQIAASLNLRSQKEPYIKLAFEALEKAVQHDPNDHLAAYYLALQHAMNANIVDALLHVRIALSLRAEHAASLHLFALLLTANRRAKEALEVVEDATVEFPDNLHMLHVRAYLELHQLQDVEASLKTVQQMLNIWRDLYDAQTSLDMHDSHEKGSDTRSVFQAQGHSAQSDKDSS